MTFWILAAGVMLILAVSFYFTLSRRAPKHQDTVDMAVFKDQLAEVDRDLARGVIGSEDADRLRTDISRRILALDKESQDNPSGIAPTTALILSCVVFAALAGGSYALYSTLGQPGYGDLPLKTRIANAQVARENRDTQQEFWDRMPADIPLNTAEGDYAELVTKLRETVAKRPDDLQGLTLLVQVEAGLQNYRPAAEVQSQILSVKGDTASAEDYFEYAELLIMSSNGYVSPEAEQALRATLKRDANSGGAQYYMGLLYAQFDRPDAAFQIWNGLLKQGPGDAPWIAPIRQMMPEIVFRAGIQDYEMPSAPELAGPSAADMQAAQDMSSQDRQAMIQGMVDQLSERLNSQGGSIAEWTRLIGAYGVLGNTELAADALAKATVAFANDPTGLAQLQAAAKQAGISQ